MSAARREWTFGCTGCLVIAIGLVLLPLACVLLFQAEEDWRGSQQLTKARQRWDDAGFSLKASDYYPPPAPDDQNLAALPLFQLGPDPTDKNVMTCVKLRDATNTDKHGGPLQDPEKKTDLAVLVVKAYATAFPGKNPPASHLAQLEELYPLIPELRAAAKTRTTYRLNQSFAYPNPMERPLGPVTVLISVAKLLSADARLALRENQPQVALDDFHLEFELARGAAIDPSLVGGLVSIGVTAITRGVIDDELTRHPWSDAQLAALQGDLKSVDFLALFQFDMRSEVAVNWLPLFEWLKRQNNSMSQIYGMSAGGMGNNSPLNLLRFLWPSGWWDMNAARMADTMLDSARGVDLTTRVVDTKVVEQLKDRADKIKEHLRPWNILYGVAVGPQIYAVKKFAQAQVQLDEDRIVCGLERYRLAHGSYPPTLAALVPACIDDLPHDIMTGAPYHYRLNPDGTFLLYSVGWNQRDDGGIEAKKDNGPARDYRQGDWPWPTIR